MAKAMHDGTAWGAACDEVPHEFTQLVGDALAHLHDPAYLQSHPLARILPPPAAVRPQHPSDEPSGRTLRRCLTSAIDALEPSPAAPEPRADRAGRLLRLRYVEGLDPNSVQRELCVSRAQFYRDRNRAIEALASLLIERLPGGHGAAQPLTLGPSQPGSNGASWLVSLPPLGTPAALALLSLAWGAAWFTAWSFAQTVAWPAAWAIGGAVSGAASSVLLRLVRPALGHRSPRVVFGWATAWIAAWLLGWTGVRAIEWVFPQGLVAGIDPNNVGFGVGRIAAWAGAGLFLGAVGAAPSTSARLWTVGPGPVRLAGAWAVAGAVGHLLFWALDPTSYAPGVRFALSGLAEGAVGGALTLWYLGQPRSTPLFSPD